MRFLDKNGKIFGKLNILDFLLILLAVLMVFGVAVNKIMPNRVIKNIRRMPQQRECIVKIILDRDRNFLLRNIKEGDGQKDLEGNFTALVVNAARQEIAGEPGVIVVTLKVKALLDNGGFLAFRNNVLRPGEQFSLGTSGYLLKGVVYEVAKAEN